MRFLAIFRLAAPFLAFATTTSSRPLSGAAPGIDFTVYEWPDCKGQSFERKDMKYKDGFAISFSAISYDLSEDLGDYDWLSWGPAPSAWRPVHDERKKGCHNAPEVAGSFSFNKGRNKVNDVAGPMENPDWVGNGLK
ncbi:MAG: hypothetical protein Q9202_006525 [Teloschistes flavicans]